MGRKKKYSFLISLVGLFTVFCAFSSTCYATSINDFQYSDFEKLFEYIENNSTILHANLITNYNNNLKNNTNSKQFLFNSVKNRAIAVGVTDISQIIFIFRQTTISVFYNNNGIGDILPHVKATENYQSPYYYTYFTYVDDLGNGVSGAYSELRINYSTPEFYNGTLKSGSSHDGWCKSPIVYDVNNSIFSCFSSLNFGFPYSSAYVKKYQYSTYSWRWNNNSIILEQSAPEPEPEQPSGDTSGDISGSGTITNPSGEITGNIDLSGIESSLNNIENKIPTSGEIANVISGEVGKITDTLTSQPDISDTVITSEDIESALNFEFESDPYANFWLELTNGLKNALLGTKRTIDITFQSRTWTIDLDDFAVLPAWLKIILTPFSTVFFVWVLVRWWKVILDKITSGNVDSVLKENSEERYF